VDLANSLFVLEKTDLVLPDVIPLALTRTYRQNDPARRAFGIGSTHPYDMYLWSANMYQETDLVLPDGGRIHYVRISPGTDLQTAVFEHTATPGPFYKSRITWRGLSAGWDLTLQDGTVYIMGDVAPVQAIRDRYGNTVTITRSNGQIGNITKITSPNGRWITSAMTGRPDPVSWTVSERRMRCPEWPNHPADVRVGASRLISSSKRSAWPSTRATA